MAYIREMGRIGLMRTGILSKLRDLGMFARPRYLYGWICGAATPNLPARRTRSVSELWVACDLVPGILNKLNLTFI